MNIRDLAELGLFEKPLAALAKLRSIVVHPGAAHFDDYVSCAMMLSLSDNDLSIYRREVSEADLASPVVAVIDTGMKLEPALMNFDHHQKDAPMGKASFRLIL